MKALVAVGVAASLAGCSKLVAIETGTSSPSSSGASSPSSSPSGASVPDRFDPTEDPATSQHHQIRKQYVSTPASAARLQGLPGQTCTTDAERVARERGLTGPCWDPPGGKDVAPLASLQPGMRRIREADFASHSPVELYLFDMPREGTMGGDRGNVRVHVPGVEEPIEYLPYGIQGYAAPTLPRLVGLPVRDALAALDQLDLPLLVSVEWSACEGANDTVCQASDTVGYDGFVRLTLAMRVRYRGTPDEQRELPADLEGMATDDAVARLARLGFTNVKVIETDLPCQRGIVCRTYQPGWHGTDRLIELQVRKPKPQP